MGSFFIFNKWVREDYLDWQLCGHESVAIIFVPQSHPPPPPQIESLFNTLLGQDGLICDDVGWWSRLNKGGYEIDNVEIGLGDIAEVMVTINKVAPPHGAPIGSSIIVVDGRSIL